MANLADRIEAYIKTLLRRNQGEALELGRRELADTFQCAPSQINYVLETRFTPQRGYLVESRRGGGGYLRIARVEDGNARNILRSMLERIADGCSQRLAYDIIHRLHEEGLVSPRESSLLQAALARETLRLDLPLRVRVRANILRAILIVLFTSELEAGSPENSQ
ncbi:MAG: CtsR family transcriptional regulator [Bacillota bacterium]